MQYAKSGQTDPPIPVQTDPLNPVQSDPLIPDQIDPPQIGSFFNVFIDG